MNPVLNAKNVCVTAGAEVLVNPVSLQLQTAHSFTILGETGSGKSLLAQALIGTLPSGLQAHGQVTIDGQTLDLDQKNKQLIRYHRHLWGKVIAILPQEPWLALDPLMPAATQITETYALVQRMPWRQAKVYTRSDLNDLGLETVTKQRPEQLSGGMAQRVAFAAARAGGARILIADEPTKGLDVARRDDILALLRREIEEGGALLTITHDLELARQLGGYLAIMLRGEIVEQGEAAEIFRQPRHDYTRRLIKADPVSWNPLFQRPINQPDKPLEPILRGKSLKMCRGGRSLFSNLDIAIHPGEIVGVFGASGCGKSTLGNVLLGLTKPDEGHVYRSASYPLTRFQKLYQDPPCAFAPHVKLGRLLRDLVKKHHLDERRIPLLMQHMRLSEHLLNRCAGEVSGGELQRLALLRLLLLDPVFLFADEPTSRLDLITQAEITQLLVSFARDKAMGLLLVSHDRALLEKSVDRLLLFDRAVTEAPRLRLAS